MWGRESKKAPPQLVAYEHPWFVTEWQINSLPAHTLKQQATPEK